MMPGGYDEDPGRQQLSPFVLLCFWGVGTGGFVVVQRTTDAVRHFVLRRSVPANWSAEAAGWLTVLAPAGMLLAGLATGLLAGYLVHRLDRDQVRAPALIAACVPVTGGAVWALLGPGPAPPWRSGAGWVDLLAVVLAAVIASAVTAGRRLAGFALAALAGPAVGYAGLLVVALLDPAPRLLSPPVAAAGRHWTVLLAAVALAIAAAAGPCAGTALTRPAIRPRSWRERGRRVLGPATGGLLAVSIVPFAAAVQAGSAGPTPVAFLAGVPAGFVAGCLAALFVPPIGRARGYAQILGELGGRPAHRTGYGTGYGPIR